MDVRVAYREKGWSMPDLSSITQCAGTQDEWAEAVKSGSHGGCRINGKVTVAKVWCLILLYSHFINKVAGNFHIAPGQSIKEMHQHVHDLHSINPSTFNTTHEFTHFAFGHAYPNKKYPLDQVTTVSEKG
jgi:hypothetical protein